MIDVFDILANKIGVYLSNSAERNEDEQEAIVYFFKRLFKYLSWFALVFLFSFFLHVKLLAFISLTSFIAMRHRFNGSHMNSSYLCLIYSVIVPIVIALIAIKVNISFLLILITYVLFLVVIINIKPQHIIDECTYTVSDERLYEGRKEGLIILTVLMVLSLVSMIFSSNITDAIFLSVAYCVVDYVKCEVLKRKTKG